MFKFSKKYKHDNGYSMHDLHVLLHLWLPRRTCIRIFCAFDSHAGHVSAGGQHLSRTSHLVKRYRRPRHLYVTIWPPSVKNTVTRIDTITESDNVNEYNARLTCRINTWRPKQNGGWFKNDFWNTFLEKEISYFDKNFQWSLLIRAQLTIR